MIRTTNQQFHHKNGVDKLLQSHSPFSVGPKQRYELTWSLESTLFDLVDFLIRKLSSLVLREDNTWFAVWYWILDFHRMTRCVLRSNVCRSVLMFITDQIGIGHKPWTSIFQFCRTKSKIRFDNTFWFISSFSTTKKSFPKLTCTIAN